MNIIHKILAWFCSLFASSPQVQAVVVPVTQKRIRLSLGALLYPTAGNRHEWFDSNIGKVRKPIIVNKPIPLYDKN